MTGKAKIICNLRQRSVMRINKHLQSQRGLHKIAKDSPLYAEQLAKSKALTSSMVTPVSTLQELLDTNHPWLRSASGGQKAEKVAADETAGVSLLLKDVLDGEPYRPALLKRLENIGDSPDGLLWRYEHGYARL